jgi:hypothetical protein
MKRLYTLTALFFLLLFGCDNGIDKSLIVNAVKLNSPYSDFTLYRYHVGSSMAFGSGFTSVKILPTAEECDYTDRDFYTFGNNYPLLIKWKNKDTLTVKCIGDGSLADKQPIKKDFQKWKDWTFEVEYYSIYSTGTNGSHTVEDYELRPNSILFKTSSKLLTFNNSKVELDLDSNQILLRQFEVDTFKSKTGLSISNYVLNMNSNYKLNDFYGLQPFIKTKP